MKPALGSDRTCRRSGKPRPALTGEEELHTSTDRILTTHAGSIPRGEPLGDMLIDEEAGKPVDKGALQSNVELRVSHVLEKQAEAGVATATFGNVLAEVRRRQSMANETSSVLQKLYDMANAHFRHGMTTPFTLKPPEVDFVFVSCVAGILLFVRL